MPRLSIEKRNAILHEQALADNQNGKVTVPAAAGMCTFFAVAVDRGTEQFFALNKIDGGYNDVKQGPYLTMNCEPEHYGLLEVPEDWPAPLEFKPPTVAPYFTPLTALGRNNHQVCDMTPSSISCDVYDTTGACKTGGVIEIGGEHMHYNSPSQGASGGTFSGLVRGYDGTAAAPHYGHDMGSINPGPPPVPPDTVHDSVSVRVPGRCFTGFITMGMKVEANYPATANYAPSRAANGIFMLIMMRMISYLSSKKLTSQQAIKL